MSTQRPEQLLVWLWAGLLLALLVVMAPGLHGGFFFDDFPNIVKNSAIHITSLDLESLVASTQGMSAGPLGRPVSVISFAVNHYLFGLNPWTFKVFNLLIHAINGLLVFWLLRLYLDGRVDAALARWLPLWVAAAWLLHPINVTPVLLAVQRMTLLSATFLLLACIALLKALQSQPGGKARWGWMLGAWLVFWPLSFLSKENGLLFPLFVLVAALFTPDMPSRWRRAVNWMAIVAAAAGVLLILLGWEWIHAGYRVRNFTMAERLMTEARALWFYLFQIVTPNPAAFGLYHDDFAISRDLLRPWTTLPAILGWLLVPLLLWLARTRWPLACLGVAWFLVGHVMESTVIGLELVFEHRNYLPSLGLLAAIAVVLGRFIQRQSRVSSRLVLVLSLIPLIFLSVLSGNRCNELGDPNLWPLMEVKRHPDSPRANHMAGRALINLGYGKPADAEGWALLKAHLLRSAEIDPTYKGGYATLLLFACLSGREPEGAWLSAIAHQLRSLPFGSSDNGLAFHMLDAFVQMPTCLARADVQNLFMAGAGNMHLEPNVRADFYRAALAYEMRVGRDAVSAREHLLNALKLVPQDVELNALLKRFNEAAK